MIAQLWTAEVVYAGFGTPMLNGAIAVVGGHIAGVGGLEELRRAFPQAEVIHKGKALTPAPANAHTHLDLSALPRFSGHYADFIRYVIASTDKRGLEAAKAGYAELAASGVGAFGDIVARDEVMDFLLEASALPGVAYREVIGVNPEKAQEVFKAMRPRLLAWKKREGKVRVGLSPHTAHTVSAPLLQSLAEFARLEGFPLQIHLAESPAEVEYLRRGSGPLAPLLAPYRGRWGAPGVSPVQYLADLGVLGTNLTLVHGVQVDAADVQILAQSGCKVVSCPRSNQGLGCGEFPWQLYLKHGVEVALGTDSKASSPDLDVKNEALSLWEKVDPRVVVRAATRGSYRVLGLEPPRLTRGTPAAQIHIW
ncbi:MULTISPECIES: amidohydrolase family protein [unclassified Meiothermus]|uniref:amidohydrolase family protein n=1 Tax=unclassified Meiothermus TaxID=370471 RepID=UPI000D7CBBBF|nr:MULTISPECIES: amidohydrolase family protein [unclassified Meiothermus]PZA08441.1 amidohydrolase [Meiothermus sp. Pnk-1]RYM37110.1 amidohydrolase [Meiothermus sp. PNK-Is4]